MITQVFDNGWGMAYAAKQFEQSLINQMLLTIQEDRSRTVVINSVWYTQDYHDQIMDWCAENDFDHIVLVAMLDPAIPWPDRFEHLGRPVTALGYYPGIAHVDFWALFVDRFFDCPPDLELLDPSRLGLPFMCLNRKPHWHRQRLYKQLQDMDLVRQGLVSMGGDQGQALYSLALDCGGSDLAPNAGTEKHGIPNDIVSLGHFANWQRCFLNVVTETVFDIDRYYFVSEKIYKPMVGCRPFLVYDSNGARQWLEHRGFQTYITDFSDISDLDLGLSHNLAPFLKTLSNQSVTYFQKKFVDLKEKILYNKNQFSIYVRHHEHLVQKGITCPI